jgi:hypothetical protein
MWTLDNDAPEQGFSAQPTRLVLHASGRRRRPAKSCKRFGRSCRSAIGLSVEVTPKPVSAKATRLSSEVSKQAKSRGVRRAFRFEPRSRRSERRGGDTAAKKRSECPSDKDMSRCQTEPRSRGRPNIGFQRAVWPYRHFRRAVAMPSARSPIPAIPSPARPRSSAGPRWRRSSKLASWLARRAFCEGMPSWQAVNLHEAEPVTRP